RAAARAAGRGAAGGAAAGGARGRSARGRRADGAGVAGAGAGRRGGGSRSGGGGGGGRCAAAGGGGREVVDRPGGGLRATERTARGAHPDLLESLRALPEARCDLHHHVILVHVVVDGRYLPLAEGVVERVVDLGQVDTQSRGGAAIDVECDVQTVVLAIGVNVRDLRHDFQRLRDPRCPQEQLAQIIAQDGVLILRIALAPAGADVLDRLQE